MDLRERKTKRHIREAFLKLRAKKPLERITVKELAEAAEISKATFYLHYQDIYDLSEKLQDALMDDILVGISHPELYLTDIPAFLREIFASFFANQELIDILFEGNQASALPLRIEKELRALVFKVVPEKKKDAKFNISLTFQIQGCYYAYEKHHATCGTELLIEGIGDILAGFDPLTA